MLTKEQAEERVARGAAHLDKVRPGWWNRIDVGTLTLSDPCGCIVGQLSGGSYNDNRCLRQLFPMIVADERVNWGDYYGVNPRYKNNLDWDADCRTLQDAWIAAIADRQLREQNGIEEARQPESVLA